jgi:spore maturation protein CgeB
VPLTRGMRLLIVHPGASMSTHDVWAGVTQGFAQRGHELFDYALDARIERAGAWLMWNWRKGGKLLPKPQAPDILYKAGEELVARALRVQPDWVLVISAMYIHPDVVVLLKRAGLRVAILFTESPYDDDRQARLLPFVSGAWTNERTTARKWNIPYVPHAYRPDVHAPYLAIPEDTPTHDVVFVGTGFAERVELLAGVDWTGIDLGLYGTWELIGSRSKLRPFIKGGYVSNEKTVALYRRAKIGLNLYRTSQGFGKSAPRVTEAESLNPRAYELAATGCFSLSTPRAEVTEIFGEAVPTFDTASDLQALVSRWLPDDAGRAAVAARLPALVTPHTWVARAARMEANLLAALSAPSRPSMARAVGG